MTTGNNVAETYDPLDTLAFGANLLPVAQKETMLIQLLQTFAETY